MMKQFFTIALIAVLFNLGFSQTDFSKIRFENLSVDQGLSQSTVRIIEQDRLGFMWFSTHNGLNRFDGKSFSVYYNMDGDSTSLSNNFIKGIDEAKDGSIWVATSNGINRLDRNTDRFTRYYNEPNNPNSLPDNNVNHIYIDSEDIIWVGTQTKGLATFNPQTGIFKSIDSPVSDTIQDLEINYIFEDTKQRIWVGFGDGDIHIFDKKTESFTIVPYGKLGKAGLAKTTWSIYEDKVGHIWVATDRNGLKLYDDKTNTFKTYLHDPGNPKSISNNVVWALNEDDNGNLLIATDNGLNFLNLAQFNEGQPEFEILKSNPLNPYSIASNFVIEIFKDKTGIIWIGTSEKGISRLDPNFLHFEHIFNQTGISNTLSNNTVWGVYEDHQGIVWIGTSNGLNSFDRATGKFNQFFNDPNNKKSISHNRTWCILQESENVYWLGTSKGLNKMVIKKNKAPVFTSYEYDPESSTSISTNSVRVLLIDNLDNFWVGTNAGLNLFDRTTGTFTRFLKEENIQTQESISGNSIRSIYQDKRGNLWVGTDAGLNLYDYKSKTFSKIDADATDSKSLSNEVVRCISEDQIGNLWVGTSNGLNRIKYNSYNDVVGIVNIDKFSEKDGLPNQVIYSIVEDNKNNIWVSTNQGLSRFNQDTELFSNYTYKDGLQSNEFNNGAVFKNEKGELFFGGINGLNIFNPSEILENKRIPRVVLTEFSIYNSPVTDIPGPNLSRHINIAEKVNLTRNVKMFAFKFSAMNYTQSHKNQFAYRLVNFDSDWNYVGNQDAAFYTNIPPGDYEFQVKASNNIGEWSDEPTSVDVYVKPAFWQTNIFRFLSIFLVLGIAYLLYYLRVRGLQKSKEVLELAVKERTEQIQSQNKKLEEAFNGLKAAQQQLVQSEKMASLGQLTAGVAHEINNPINFVASNVQALKMDFDELGELLDKVAELKDSPDKSKMIDEIEQLNKQLETNFLKEEMLELINGIERGASRTQTIVSSLHTFSRNRSEKFLEANIHEGLESTLIILKSKIGKDIKINKNFGDIPSIECQISKLNQVFLNVINNAIEAVDGKGEININTSRQNGSIFIKIKDNGRGMDEQTRNRIFEPFFTTKDVGDGTGLGLSISYGIVKQHSGTIEVSSQQQQGTEFLIKLPIQATEN